MNARVEAAAIAAYNQVRDDRYHGEGKAWSERSPETQAQWCKVISAALAAQDQPASLGQDTAETIEQIICRTNSLQNADSHQECLRQLACINLLATRVLATLRTAK